jgi:hypothetical protein
MASPPLVNLSSLIDNAKCYALVRQHRWPDGVRCPQCRSAAVTRNGHDDAQPRRIGSGIGAEAVRAASTI